MPRSRTIVIVTMMLALLCLGADPAQIRDPLRQDLDLDGNSIIQNDFAWDTGRFELGDVFLWSEDASGGTDDIFRIIFNSAPGSATAGNVVLHSSGNANHGVVHWGVSDAASFDTGTEICTQYQLTCVDSDLFGSAGGATTCATAHADTTNFWAMCQ